MSIISKMRDGWRYMFNQAPPARNDTAQRAGFLMFQTYPANDVQGAATLTRGQSGAPGYFFRVLQSPQVVAKHVPVQADLLGGGTQSGAIYTSPLTDTNNATG